MKHRILDKWKKGDLDWVLIMVAGLIVITPFVFIKTSVTGDEVFNEAASLKLIYENLNTGFLYMPNLNYYLVSFVFMAIYLLTGHAAGTDTALNLVIHYLTNPRMYLIGARLVSMAAGLGILWMVYLIGKRLWNRTTGLYAAIFTLFSIIFVHFSSIVSPYNTSIFFALVSYYWMLRILDHRKKTYYIMSGIFYGLSVSSLYIPGLLIIPFLAVHLFRPVKPAENTDRPVSLIKGILIFAVPAALSFIIASPQVVLNSSLFMHDLIWRVGNTSHPEVSWAKQPFFFYFTELKNTSGLIILLLALSGVFILPFTRKRYDWFALIFPVAYLLFFSMFSSKFDRYILPVAPFLMLIAARALLLGWKLLLNTGLRERTAKIIFLSVLVFILITPSQGVLKQYRRWSNIPNYKHSLETVIAKDMPDNALVILLSDSTLDYWNYSPFNNNHNNFARIIKKGTEIAYHHKKIYFYSTYYFTPIQFSLNDALKPASTGFIIFDLAKPDLEKYFPRLGKKYKLLLKRIKENSKLYYTADQSRLSKRMKVYALPVHKLISIINSIKPFSIKSTSGH